MDGEAAEAIGLTHLAAGFAAAAAEWAAIAERADLSGDPELPVAATAALREAAECAAGLATALRPDGGEAALRGTASTVALEFVGMAARVAAAVLESVMEETPGPTLERAHAAAVAMADGFSAIGGGPGGAVADGGFPPG